MYAGPAPDAGAVFYRAHTSRAQVIVDMERHALSFQVNEGEIVELSNRECELPELVQPWVLLGHGGDQVTISEVADVC